MGIEDRSDGAPEREPPAWTIEVAEEADAPDILRVQRDSWLATYGDSAEVNSADIEAHFSNVEYRVAKWKEKIVAQGKDRRIWVVRAQGNVVGFCYAEKKETEHELEQLYVLPSNHKNGCGLALMRQALLWLGGEGQNTDRKKIVLRVFRQNEKAIAFYVRNGFKESVDVVDDLLVNGKPMKGQKMEMKEEQFQSVVDGLQEKIRQIIQKLTSGASA